MQFHTLNVKPYTVSFYICRQMVYKKEFKGFDNAVSYFERQIKKGVKNG